MLYVFPLLCPPAPWSSPLLSHTCVPGSVRAGELPARPRAREPVPQPGRVAGRGRRCGLRWSAPVPAGIGFASLLTCICSCRAPASTHVLPSVCACMGQGSVRCPEPLRRTHACPFLGFSILLTLTAILPPPPHPTPNTHALTHTLLLAADGAHQVDWAVSDPAGPHVRQEVHPHHCECERAPAHLLGLLLLRPSRRGALRPRGHLLPLPAPARQR